MSYLCSTQLNMETETQTLMISSIILMIYNKACMENKGKHPDTSFQEIPQLRNSLDLGC